MPKTIPTIATGLGPDDVWGDGGCGVGVDGGRVHIFEAVVDCALWGCCVPRGVLAKELTEELCNEDVELSVLEASEAVCVAEEVGS